MLAETLTPQNIATIVATWTRQLGWDWHDGTVTRALYQKWAQFDPFAAARSLLDHPNHSIRESAMNAIIAQWTQTDRDAAMRWIAALPEGGAKRGAHAALLQSWLREDFKAASAWVLALPFGDDRVRLLQQAAYIVSDDDPSAALELVEFAASARVQNRMLETIGEKRAERDPQAALDWAEAQTDDDIRATALEGVAMGMLAETPEQAAEVALTVPGDRCAGVVGNVLANWGDSLRAAEWAEQISEPSLRQRAIGQIMYNWIAEDPAPALAWFSKFPASKERDEQVVDFTSVIAGNDPMLAVQWAQSLSGPRHRTSTIESVAEIWLENDWARASKWIGAANLPSDVKSRLFTRFPKPTP